MLQEHTDKHKVQIEELNGEIKVREVKIDEALTRMGDFCKLEQECKDANEKVK